MTLKEDKILQEEIQKYIDEDINWCAFNNEIIKTANKSEMARGDVEQFAMDSFAQGWMKAREFHNIK